MISVNSSNSQKALLSGDKEALFRNLFIYQYPAFMYVLRKEIPNITRNEELMSMLIVLNQRTQEMASLLCISPSSVNQARYRLRKRIGLKPGEGLDSYIKQVFQKSCDVKN